MTDKEKELAVKNLKDKLVIGTNKLILSTINRVGVNKVQDNIEEVGTRFQIKFGPYTKYIDCEKGYDKILEDKYFNGCKHIEYSPLKGKIKDNTILFGNDEGVLSIECTSEVAEIMNYCAKLAYIDMNLRNYIDEILRDAGHGSGEDPRYDTNEFSCRYWGGYGAWHNPTEYEDWDWEELDLKYGKALKKAIDNFNKKYRLNAYFSVEEKNWICISIR